jgi:hypothetical protein
MDGVAAFTSDLRRVDWPAGFKPTGIEKYDGTTNPESWLTSTVWQFAQREETAKPWQTICLWP